MTTSDGAAPGRALLVIDVQRSFQVRPSWAAVNRPDIVARANRLVDAARDRGDAVFWVLHTEPGTGNEFDPAVSEHVVLMDGLEPREDEPVLTKTTRNCFTSTDLDERLAALGVRSLTLCGIQTEQCCETTARVAADLGYDVTFVTEATATFPIPHRDADPGRPYAELLADPRTLATDAVTERTEYALAHRFARIATLDEVAPVPA